MAKQYAYCPVIPWIMAAMGFSEPPTPSMESGRLNAFQKEEIAAELRLPKPWRIEYEVVSSRLGLRGRVDIVAGGGPYIVVEVKRYARRVKRLGHFKAQLMVYALLVSDVLGPVREAILVVGRKPLVYTVTGGDLRRAARMVEETRRVLVSEEPPRTTARPEMCEYCWYRRLCPWRSL